MTGYASNYANGTNSECLRDMEEQIKIIKLHLPVVDIYAFFESN